jgi:hypothetical protein
MKNFALAVKHGVKDFFKRQADHSDFTKVHQHFEWWDYDELCLLTVLAGVHKHTFGVPGSIIQAIKEGRWKYHDLKNIEASAPSIFKDTKLSPEGQKRILKVLKQGRDGDSQMFSRDDDEVMSKFFDAAGIHRDNINYP